MSCPWLAHYRGLNSRLVMWGTVSRPGRDVVGDASGHESALHVRESAVGQVPDGGHRTGERSPPDAFPARDGRGPLCPDEARRQVGVAIGGIEVPGRAAVVEEHPGRNGPAMIGERDVEAAVVHLIPGRRRGEEE